MSEREGDRLAAAAAGLIDTPFRLNGRDPRRGLDCIGVLFAALRAIGSDTSLPSGYTLRLRDLDRWLPDPAAHGFMAAHPPFLPGDAVMQQLGGGQFHLAIAAPRTGWIHAHAGLRRVIHSCALPDGPIIHHWRLAPATSR